MNFSSNLKPLRRSYRCAGQSAKPHGHNIGLFQRFGERFQQLVDLVDFSNFDIAHDIKTISPHRRDSPSGADDRDAGLLFGHYIIS